MERWALPVRIYVWSTVLAGTALLSWLYAGWSASSATSQFVVNAAMLAVALMAAALLMVFRSNRQLADLHTTNGRLEAALAEQRRFVADAAHELRTPLTAIRGNVDLLLADTLLGAATRNSLRNVSGEIHRLSRLVTDLLTLAQADAGQALYLVPTDLEELTYDVYRQMRPLAGHVTMHFALNEADHEAVVTAVDPDRCWQLMSNLLDNAIKYTPPGQQVTVQVRYEAGWALIEVSDTGIGIAADQQGRIFERFYRVGEARAVGGAGLGLPIARWVAEAHGGTLTVVSTPGAGSTFTVRLPLRNP